MDRLFITILNMSFTGAFVIVTICLVRLLLKKAPTTLSYSLWAVAGIRLLFPFSIESIWSLIPFQAQPIPMHTAAPLVSDPASLTAGASLTNNWIAIGGFIWLAGAASMLVYGIASYSVLKYKLRKSLHQQKNIYE